MDKNDIDYFLNVVYNFSNALPKDLRMVNLNVENHQISIEKIIEIIKKVFLDINEHDKKVILEDVNNILVAIVKNESTSNINLIGKSRFSLAFKIGRKVFKVGFPKIIYKYPDCKIILNSIIRKRYVSNNKDVLFVEVQEYRENNLKKYYSEEKIEEIVYSLWKHLRKNKIIWYDPKSENIVICDNTDNNYWNNDYYKKSSYEGKGLYNIIEQDEYAGKYLIVDTDLFLPLNAVEKMNEIYESNQELPFFKNWKYKKFLDYEKRYLKEIKNESKRSK